MAKDMTARRIKIYSMSRASKRLKKQKHDMRVAMGDKTINCPNCGVPVPNEIFLKEGFGRDYKCAVCGKIVYEEWVKKNFYESK